MLHSYPMHTLKINNLTAKIGEKHILHGVSLTINSGELHIIMGQNGSGKSTLATTVMGRPDITATSGSLLLDNNDLLSLPAHKRAQAGLFLGFQYPVTLRGVTASQCLRLALRSLCTARGNAFDGVKFNDELQNGMHTLGLDQSFISRGLNDGFSGGEKKRMEILQLMLLKPHFAILDEIDSGLDIDGLRIITNAIKELISAQNMGIMLITHYPNLPAVIAPDAVHIMNNGRLVKTGGVELAREITEHGYAKFAAS